MDFAPIALAATLLLSCAPAPPPAFDGQRALADVATQVNFGPRVAGTPGHAAAAGWLEQRLRAATDDVVVDEFEVAVLPGLRFKNLIAKFDPANPIRILLCAHWDSRPRAEHDPDPSRRDQPIPGANDAGSGVAVLLELARLFHQRAPAVGVDLVLFDGEDYGDFARGFREVLLGSQRYAKTFQGSRPRLGILLDMVGDKDLRLEQEANSVACCRSTVEKVWSVARELGHGDVFVPDPGPAILDDHIPLNRAGLGVIDIIDFKYPPWHTTGDDLDQVSARSLEIVGRVIAEVVYRERP